MAILLIPANDDDWARAWPIMRAAFEELLSRTVGGWDEAGERKAQGEWVAANVRLVMVDGELAGWCHVNHNPDHDWLNLIVIAPGFQGRGLGGEVMRQLMEEATGRGVPLWLSVWKVNRARRLYARLGFAEHPRDDNRVFNVYPPDTPATPPP